jgi:hypothetical protein
MSAFEQKQHEVGGQSILITSWFDDTAQSWRASAPAYYFYLATLPPIAYPTRQAAVEQLTDHLAVYVNSKD